MEIIRYNIKLKLILLILMIFSSISLFAFDKSISDLKKEWLEKYHFAKSYDEKIVSLYNFIDLHSYSEKEEVNKYFHILYREIKHHGNTKDLFNYYRLLGGWTDNSGFKKLFIKFERDFKNSEIETKYLYALLKYYSLAAPFYFSDGKNQDKKMNDFIFENLKLLNDDSTSDLEKLPYLMVIAYYSKSKEVTSPLYSYLEKFVEVSEKVPDKEFYLSIYSQTAILDIIDRQLESKRLVDKIRRLYKILKLYEDDMKAQKRVYQDLSYQYMSYAHTLVRNFESLSPQEIKKYVEILKISFSKYPEYKEKYGDSMICDLALAYSNNDYSRIVRLTKNMIQRGDTLNYSHVRLALLLKKILPKINSVQSKNWIKADYTNTLAHEYDRIKGKHTEAYQYIKNLNKRNFNVYKENLHQRDLLIEKAKFKQDMFIIAGVVFTLLLIVLLLVIHSLKKTVKELNRTSLELKSEKEKALELQESAEITRDYEVALNKTASALLELTDESIDVAIEYILKACGASKISLYHNEKCKEGHLCMRISNRYLDKRFKHADIIHQADYIEFEKAGIGRWIKVLSNNEMIADDVKTLEKNEREFLEVFGIVFMVVIPIFVQNKWVSSLCISICDDDRKMSKEELNMAVTACKMFSSFYEVRRYQDEIKRSNALLKNAIEMKDKTTSILRHDLRNPIGSIMGFSELLLEDDYEYEEKVEFVKNIHRTTTEMLNMVDNFTQWIEAVGEEIKPEFEEIDLSKIINSSISLCKMQAHRKKIKLISKFDEELLVLADEKMVSTIVRNIISNAIKFTDDGGFVLCSYKIEKDFIQISIEDNGVGISKANMDRLRRNISLSTLGTQGEKGTGFGISICEEFAKMNGGDFDIYSEEGVGTKIVFTLKLIK
ncbi:HAMP domain-containing histidine kinase [Marinilabiliaceae bacterium JC040]|nr:HAMP domain-containing histidine kinase [Marinilabiliaceae bacterium JC040]